MNGAISYIKEQERKEYMRTLKRHIRFLKGEMSKAAGQINNKNPELARLILIEAIDDKRFSDV